MDNSGDTLATFHAKQSDCAGVRSGSGSKPDRPFRKPGMSMKSNMDQAIWGRDLDYSGYDFKEEHFASTNDNSAGVQTGRQPKSVRADEKKKKEAAMMSRSTPNLHGLAPSETSDLNFEFAPASRRRTSDVSSRASQCQTARSPTSNNPRQVPCRRTSGSDVGSVTSRDYGAHYTAAGGSDAGIGKSPKSARGVTELTEKALSATQVAEPGRKAKVRSQCSTASSSAGVRPRWN